ncbi:BapA prefix-like domain-containing protein [Thioalkalivibrio nitratireducens]|uniref:BapA prefix-like domain-containing protein n=1 Tax=Thioalkalivibrio nitratireducens TaxID=186931 RepID=UPI0012EDDBF0
MRPSTEVIVVDKATGASSEVAIDALALTQAPASIVQLPVGPEEVASFRQIGDDLVILLKSGREITVDGFFAPAEGRHELILRGQQRGSLVGPVRRTLGRVLVHRDQRIDRASGSRGRRWRRSRSPTGARCIGSGGRSGLEQLGRSPQPPVRERFDRRLRTGSDGSVG